MAEDKEIHDDKNMDEELFGKMFLEYCEPIIQAIEMLQQNYEAVDTKVDELGKVLHEQIMAPIMKLGEENDRFNGINDLKENYRDLFPEEMEGKYRDGKMNGPESPSELFEDLFDNLRSMHGNNPLDEDGLERHLTNLSKALKGIFAEDSNKEELPEPKGEGVIVEESKKEPEEENPEKE